MVCLGGGGDVEILQLDADGNTSFESVLELWTLRNCWISKITPSELNYSSEELSTIDCTLVYDFAELKSREFPVAIHTKTAQF